MVSLTVCMVPSCCGLSGFVPGDSTVSQRVPETAGRRNESPAVL